jgi:hypothetical protein
MYDYFDGGIGIMTDIAKSIKAINPNAEFSVNAEDYNQITWLNGTTPIAVDDIKAKQTELQTEYDALSYARKRAIEYPTIEECVHAILDDTLTDLQAKRTAVKNKYPKESS